MTEPAICYRYAWGMSLGVVFSALRSRDAAAEPTWAYLRRDEKITPKFMLAQRVRLDG